MRIIVSLYVLFFVYADIVAYAKKIVNNVLVTQVNYSFFTPFFAD